MSHPPRRSLLPAALLALACGGEAPPQVDPDSRRTLTNGDVVGSVGDYGSHVWRAIPYARPPVGELRWRAPQRPERWAGGFEALGAGPVCPQLASPLGGVDDVDRGEPTGDEDCLTLDVYAPKRAADELPAVKERFPVMVWLHGGGNVVGGSRLYDGGRLAATHDVVVVAVQYRLGPLGFFRHASLRVGGGSPEDRSGNFALLDQIRALEWVRENAEAFGGDPGRVTVFGESAGGRDTFMLMLSPKARGLFHRAVVQSGGTRTVPAHAGENFVDDPPPGAPNSSNEVLLRLLQQRGADGREEARQDLASMSPAEVARFLRELPPEELIAAYEREDVESNPDVPQMFRDGTVLPLGEPLELAAGGAAAEIPVVLGTNRDEWRVFLLFNDRYVDWLLGMLPQVRDEDRFLAASDHLSRMWSVTGVDEPAAALHRARPGRVFAYRFDWDEEPVRFGGLVDSPKFAGAFHGLEIAFVFGHWNLGGSSRLLFSDENRAGREALAEQMMSYWAQLAHTGAPGRGRSGELPEWKAWQPGAKAPSRLVFDTPAGGGVRMEPVSATAAAVLRGVEEDPRLETAEQRCGVYYELASFGRGFSREDYERAEACAGIPFARWQGE